VWWVVAGVSLTLVLVAGTAVGGVTYVVHRLQDAQRENYAAGHTAYLEADCARAIPRFDQATERRLDQRIAILAERERQACQELVTSLDEAAGLEPAEAVHVHLDYLDSAADESLRTTVRQKVLGIVSETASAELVAGRVCSRIDDLDTVLEQAEAEGDEWLPSLLLACAKGWVRGAKEELALGLYQRVEKEYPRTGYARKATAAIVTINYGTAKQLGAKRWDPPTRLGTDPSLGGKVQVRIVNATPAKLTLMLAGPDALVRTAKKCAECRAYPSLAVARCPAASPSVTVTVSPGSYRAVIGDIEGLPGIGDWTFRANGVYLLCSVMIGKQQGSEV
jgi:hypothetical protein